MKTMLTRIHLGLGLDEVGVQFEVEDGAGGHVTQRSFVRIDEALLAPVWLAVQTALAEKLDALPIDLPPGNVTTALMRQRNAEAAAESARRVEVAAVEAASRAEERRQRAEEERLLIESAKASRRAELEALDEEIATKRAAKAMKEKSQ